MYPSRSILSHNDIPASFVDSYSYVNLSEHGLCEWEPLATSESNASHFIQHQKTWTTLSAKSFSGESPHQSSMLENCFSYKKQRLFFIQYCPLSLVLCISSHLVLELSEGYGSVEDRRLGYLLRELLTEASATSAKGSLLVD
ncbi:hypothetical protein Tco_1193614 [Tanacetum coccineum]